MRNQRHVKHSEDEDLWLVAGVVMGMILALSVSSLVAYLKPDESIPARDLSWAGSGLSFALAAFILWRQNRQKSEKREENDP